MKGTGYSLTSLCFSCRKAYKQPALRIVQGHYVPSDIKRGALRAADESEATCTFFGTFVETRYDDPEKIPPGDERLLYHVYCFCGMIDGDV